MHLPWRDMLPPGAKPGQPAISTSLTENEALELARLATGKIVLEIGSAYGFSAVTMSLGGARSVTAVDPHDWCVPPTLSKMKENLAAYGIPEFTFGVPQAAGVVAILERTFFDVAAEIPESGIVNFVFIDGDHSFATVHHDFRSALRLLAPGGVIACHDYLEDSCPGVRQALDELIPEGPSRIVDTLAIYENLKEAA